MPRFNNVLASAAILAAAAASAAPAQTITTLIREGQEVPGVGTVTGVDGYAVNNSGVWVVEADTNNPDTTSDLVLLRGGSIYWRENDAFGGANVSSWGPHSLNNGGDLFGSVNLRPTSPTDSGFHFNKTMTLQEGTVSTAAGFSPGTPYIGFFGGKVNDARRAVAVTSVDDPNIATTVDRALMFYTVSPAGALLSETIIAKEGDVLPGAGALALADVETASNEYDLSQTGEVIWGADLSGTTADNAIYRYSAGANTLLAIEGGNSPVAGRTWANLSGPEMSISGNGQHVVYTGILSGDTTTDNVIVKDDAVFRQEGDNVPGLPQFQFTSFGTAPIQVDDAGNVVWFGDWNDAVTTQDTGLFYNDTLVVQEGVTQIDGLTVMTIRSFVDTLDMSDNGQFVVFEAELAGGLEGAFMIAVPEPGTLGLAGMAAAGLVLRRRRERGAGTR
jgi:hypothetical protein